MNAASSHTRRRRRWLIFGSVIALLFAVSAAYVLALPQFGGKPAGDRLARVRANPQYRDGAFVNQVAPASYRFADVWTIFTGQFFGDEVRVPPAMMPVLAVTPDELKSVPPAPGLRAFWIGHASVYVEIERWAAP